MFELIDNYLKFNVHMSEAGNGTMTKYYKILY